MTKPVELMSLFWTTAGIFPGNGEISRFDFKPREEKMLFKLSSRERSFPMTRLRLVSRGGRMPDVAFSRQAGRLPVHRFHASSPAMISPNYV
jgi:hypothetical protein